MGWRKPHANVSTFRAPDERWHLMKAVWDSCQAAEIQAPELVFEYFNDADPDPAGIEVPLTYPEVHAAVSEWSDGRRSGFDVDLEKLPPGTLTLRFYNSW